MILKKLNNVELLYSLMRIDAELNKIVSDSIFIRYLVLLRNDSNDRICPLIDTVLDQFCLQILPQIHYKIKCLTLESSFMEHILFAGDYLNLYGLGLYNVDEKNAKRFFIGKVSKKMHCFSDIKNK